MKVGMRVEGSLLPPRNGPNANRTKAPSRVDFKPLARMLSWALPPQQVSESVYGDDYDGTALTVAKSSLT